MLTNDGDPINYWSPHEDPRVEVDLLRDSPIPFLSVNLVGQASMPLIRSFRAILAQREARFLPGSRIHLLAIDQARGIVHTLRAKGFEVIVSDAARDVSVDGL